jgi:ribonuclease HI
MEKVIVYTDGGSRGNPGPSGIGVVICDNAGKVIKEYGEYLGPRFTNNEAEYQAVISAFKKIKSLFGKGKIKSLDIEFFADSELMVKQLSGEYKVLNENIQPLFLLVWNAKLDFGKVSFKHIPREQNKQADKWVNQALDAETGNNGLF